MQNATAMSASARLGPNASVSVLGLPPCSEAARPVAHPRIARSLRFMAENWHRPIKVMDLARVSGLSRRGFLKAFHQHTRSRPHQTLERWRMTRAEELMLRGVPLKQVFPLCGYRSLNSFYVAFRRFQGVPPQEYLRRTTWPRSRLSTTNVGAVFQ